MLEDRRVLATFTPMDVPGLIDAVNVANANGQDDTIDLGGLTFTLNDSNFAGDTTDGLNGLPSIESDGGSSLVITNGVIARDTNSTEEFRLIHVQNGAELSLDQITISGGSAPKPGGLNGVGGGIFNRGTLSVENSVVAGNTASGLDAGGRSAGLGGGFFNADGSMSVVNSVVAGNTASGGGGGGGFGGGFVNADGSTLSVVNSVVAGNTASGGAGGGFGGGFFNADDSTLSVVNSTVAGNSAFRAGGGFFNDDTLSVVNSTVAGNSAFLGGGVFNGPDSLLSVLNSIVAGNVSGANQSDIELNAGARVSGNNNLIGDAATSGELTNGTNGNIVGVDWTTVLENDGTSPILADNGGPTQTIALLEGSDAIDAGDNLAASDTGLTTDQRGPGFSRFVGTVDIGATEFQALMVTTDQDIVDPLDNLTSLREALAFANSDSDFSEITFGDGSSLTGGTDFTDATGDTITLGGTQLVISSDLTITGPGADLLTVSGNDQSRVFRIGIGDHDVTFAAFAITKGKANRDGGGIKNVSTGTLSLTDLEVSDSSVPTHSGGGGGGIFHANGTLIVDRSLISRNTAPKGGGLSIIDGAAYIRGSSVADNVSNAQEIGGGIYAQSGTLTVRSSTISGNSVIGPDSFLNAQGGGIGAFPGASVSLINSTVTGNLATALGDTGNARGGGVWASNMTVINSTITANTVSTAGFGTARGGGIARNGGTISINNSIVAGNVGDTGPDLAGGGFVRNSSQIGIPADLTIDDLLDTTLADNGGPTLTHALVPGSPAIDAGDNTLAVDSNGDPLNTDQRGDGFDRVIGGTVDIGAFESDIQNLPPVANAGGPYTVAEGSSVALDGSGSGDPDNDTLTYEWDFNYLVGGTFDVDATGVAPDFTGVDDGDVTVALRVSDGTESSEIVMTTVTVTNEDPAISGLNTDAATLESKSDDGVVTLDGLVTDAGNADTHEVVIDWGDGTVETIVAAGDLVVGPDFSGTQHTYATGGIYTINVTVTDDDGGSVSKTTSAVVQGVGLVDGVLYIIGTNGDDSVTLKERHQGTQLKVRTKFDGGPTQSSYFDIADINSIEMHLCDGDDYASMTQGHWWHQHSVDIPATIHGGDGNDVLIGGSANDVIDGGNGDDCLHGEYGDDTIHGGDGHDWIEGGSGDDIVYAGAGNDRVWGGFGNDIVLGQAGNDKLFGGWGKDILIAGEGADRVFGQGQDDILITGDTNFDTDETKLKQMREDWTGSGSFSDRQQAILDSGLEVTHDVDVDKVWGGCGQDWIWFDSDLDRKYW